MKTPLVLVLLLVACSSSAEESTTAPAPLPTQAELVNERLQEPLCEAFTSCGVSCGGLFPVALSDAKVLCSAADVDECARQTGDLAAGSYEFDALDCERQIYSGSPILSLPAICFGCLDLPTKTVLVNDYLSVRYCAAGTACGEDCGGSFPVAFYDGELVACTAAQMVTCINETYSLTCAALQPDYFDVLAHLPASCAACL